MSTFRKNTFQRKSKFRYYLRGFFIFIFFERKNSWLYPANTQGWFNVDICWNNVRASVKLISTLVQCRFVNVTSSIKFNGETKLILGWLKNNFVLISWSLKNSNLYINVEKVTGFQRRSNVNLSTFNQSQNLTLKERWF